MSENFFDEDGLPVEHGSIVVTSRKPEDLPAFCREAMKVLVEAPDLGGVRVR
jgi:hypothetical protein